jgi:hypothetical protein
VIYLLADSVPGLKHSSAAADAEVKKLQLQSTVIEFTLYGEFIDTKCRVNVSPVPEFPRSTTLMVRSGMIYSIHFSEATGQQLCFLILSTRPEYAGFSIDAISMLPCYAYLAVNTIKYLNDEN